MAKVELDAGEVMENLTIAIRMPVAFGSRMRLVGWLIRIARLISPVEIDARVDDASEA